MPVCVWSWKFYCRNVSLSQNRAPLNFLSFAHKPALQTLSRSCRERWNDGCARARQTKCRAENCNRYTRGKENMGMERLIASCEDYRGMGINRKVMTGKWWWEVEGGDEKAEMFITPSSQSFFVLSHHLSVGQLTAQWESNYHLSTGEEWAALHLLPLPSSFSPLSLLHFLVLCLLAVKTLRLTLCERKSSRRSQMTDRILIC